MSLSENDARNWIKQLSEETGRERNRLNAIHKYMKNQSDAVYSPENIENEFQWVLKRAKFNLLPMVVSVVAQNLYVDGYRSKEKKENDSAWEIWQANRFDSLQHGVHRSAGKYGYSFVVSLPGQLEDEPMPVFRPVSPRRMQAAYRDEILDEWPEFAVETSFGFTDKGPLRIVRLYDSENIYVFSSSEKSAEGKLEFDRTEKHGTGVCPVVKYRSLIDLDEDPTGDVQDLIPLQDQLNFTTFNLMMAQQYAAFRQRWATGLPPQVDESGAATQPFRPGIDKMIASESSETKFGEFSATDLTGYLSSRKETQRGMALINQLPPYQFVGTDDLASAEALAAARDGLDRTVNERQSNYGEAHEQLLRLGQKQRDGSEGDKQAQVIWRDTSTRAFAATVDALMKLAQGLGVPPQALWEKIPGVTQVDVSAWKKIAEDNPDEFTAMVMGRQLRQVPNGNGGVPSGNPSGNGRSVSSGSSGNQRG